MANNIIPKSVAYPAEIIRTQLPFVTENFPRIAKGIGDWDREKAIDMYKEGASYESIAKTVKQPLATIRAYMSLRTAQDENIYGARYRALHQDS